MEPLIPVLAVGLDSPTIVLSGVSHVAQAGGRLRGLPGGAGDDGTGEGLLVEVIIATDHVGVQTTQARCLR